MSVPISGADGKGVMSVDTPATTAAAESRQQHHATLKQIAELNIINDGLQWDDLKRILQDVLLAVPPRFTPLRPPPSSPPASSPAVPGPDPSSASSTITGDPSTPSPSSSADGPSALLLSPTTPTSRTAHDPRSVGAEASSTPRHDPSESELRPSTIGGLVIPPFPPLVPNRRRRGSADLRMNGHGMGGGMGPGQGGGMFEDEWDEEVLIGGKKLPGWLPPDEADRAVARIVKMIEDLDDPPFTIQRLAELLLQPTAYHASLGKYLRAVEKTLLVTTSWEPPSYTYIPGAGVGIPTAPSMFSGSTSSASSSIASGSASSDDGSEDSMMPPGASTPMFSPIPFLVRGGDEDGDEPHHGAGPNGSGLDDGLMSPLILGGSGGSGGGGGLGNNSPGSWRFEPAPSVRSPTPEPDEPDQDHDPDQGDDGEGGDRGGDRGQDTDEQPSGNAASDPAHQPYLGRVDELDTGPIITDSPAVNGHGHGHGYSHGHGNSHGPGGAAGEDGGGTGEGGNMTPHGMSERPVPISSTTTTPDDVDRRIAALPRQSLLERFVSGSGGGIGGGSGGSGAGLGVQTRARTGQSGGERENPPASAEEGMVD